MPEVPRLRKDSAPVVNAGSAASSQQYHIAPKPLMMEASLTPERMMKAPIRLLDESLGFCDDLGPYLLDQSNFLVVAVLGLQGVGKSCLASLLVDPTINIHKSRKAQVRRMTACCREWGMPAAASRVGRSKVQGEELRL
ncbi:Protein SMG9 [Chionoecetes opilio]|uniref:Protein SMG9 n=1 Tax=Chionoecetes opilio TaxID=41210 RepID=A0A8J4XZU7_CHIOP|nr:Protein SMG9 [Chionoecetes opilio]